MRQEVFEEVVCREITSGVEFLSALQGRVIQEADLSELDNMATQLRQHEEAVCKVHCDGTRCRETGQQYVTRSDLEQFRQGVSTVSHEIQIRRAELEEAPDLNSLKERRRPVQASYLGTILPE